MENNEKWEAVKRRNKTSILQSVNKFREEANKMKRKMQRFVTVSTAAALSLAMAVPGSAAYQPEQKFQDVSRSASYYEDVMDANYYGLMAGVSGKTFDTESTITRAMWVTMLYKMAGQPAVQQGHLHRREDGRLVCPGGHLGGGAGDHGGLRGRKLRCEPDHHPPGDGGDGVQVCGAV